MNKYLAYCYLYEDTTDLKCDFEILTDEISSMIGLLRSLLDDADKAANPELAEDLCKINELMYHINPSLRTEVMVTSEELEWLFRQTQSLQKKVEGVVPAGSGLTFVLPQGCTQAAYSHVIRNKSKTLVRLLSRYKQQGNEVEEILFDCMRGVHTSPLWGGYEGMYPETNTLPKQPYPVRSAAGLVDFCNLYSGYFYFLSLWLNKNHGEKERPFISRVYSF